MASALAEQGLREVDIALVLLDSPDLSEPFRGALLEFLFLLLGSPAGARSGAYLLFICFS